MARASLLYDEDCGFCRWSVERILRWDRRGQLRAVPLQSPEADALLLGMDRRRRMASWHLVEPDGRVTSAGAAGARLLELLPGGAPIAAVARAFPGATEAAYGLVARNRDRLGRWLGERACAVDPSRTR